MVYSSVNKCLADDLICFTVHYPGPPRIHIALADSPSMLAEVVQFCCFAAPIVHTAGAC